MVDILDYLTRDLEIELRAKYMAKRTDFLGGKRKDGTTINIETGQMFQAKWKTIESRMDIVPGKDVLGALIEYVQTKYGVNLTQSKIIDAMAIPEIPVDLKNFLNDLENFRKTNPKAAV